MSESRSSPLSAVVAREGEIELLDKEIDLDVKNVLQEFDDVFPDKLPHELSPMRDIQHAIDFVQGSILPNLSHHRMDPKSHEKLKCQLDELLDRVIRESLSPCAILTLLASKKDGTWRMSVESKVINTITVKYHFSIPRLVDMFDILVRAIVFSTIDLRNGYHRVRVKISDGWKTIFKTKDGLYE